MGLELLCSGYVAPIDETNEEIILDEKYRFEKIPLRIAQDIVQQNDQINIPICIEHQETLVIGTVKALYIKSIPSYDDLGDWRFSKLLVCDFSITDQNFIYALQYVTQYKYIKQAVPYISSDNFIYSYNNCSNLTNEVIDANAYLSLTQKFAGLSIGHDANISRVKEISICVAGYRQLCLIRSVSFHKNIDLCSDINEKEVDKYKTLFAANFSLSIAHSSEKIKQDLTRLNLPKHCLVYSYPPKMYRVNDEQLKKSKYNNQDLDVNDDSNEQSALHLLQTIVKKHFKEAEAKNKRIRSKSHLSDSSDDEEEEIREYIRQKRLSRKRKHEEEPKSESNAIVANTPQPISIPYGHPCVFEPPPAPQAKKMDISPTQSKQHNIPSRALEYQYKTNKLQTDAKQTKENNSSKYISADGDKEHDEKQQMQSALSILHKFVYDL